MCTYIYVHAYYYINIYISSYIFPYLYMYIYPYINHTCVCVYYKRNAIFNEPLLCPLIQNFHPLYTIYGCLPLFVSHPFLHPHRALPPCSRSRSLPLCYVHMYIIYSIILNKRIYRRQMRETENKNKKNKYRINNKYIIYIYCSVLLCIRMHFVYVIMDR